MDENISHDVVGEKQFSGPDFTHAFSDQPFMVDHQGEEEVDVETYVENPLIHSLVQSKLTYPIPFLLPVGTLFYFVWNSS